jgi:hypothetical protein
MSLGSEIGVRLLRVIYWTLCLAELGVAIFLSWGLFAWLRGDGLTDEGVMKLIAGLIVALLTHYVLITPIGKKLAEDKTNA